MIDDRKLWISRAPKVRTPTLWFFHQPSFHLY